jgi:predicted Zn-dependent protease
MPMRKEADLACWIARLALLFAVFLSSVGCRQGSGDPLEKIRELHARGRYEASLEDLRGLMDADPSDPELNFLLAKTLMEIGEPSLAIWPLRKVMDSPAHAFEAGMMLAEATLYSRTPGDAIGAADVALGVDPDSVEALAIRAHALIKVDRYADARTDVEKAFALDPENASILVPRVLVLLEFGRIDEADAALAAGGDIPALTEDASEVTQSKLCLANAAFAVEGGDRKSAEVLYGDCLDAYPTSSLVVLEAADFYDQIEQQERATELLEKTFEDTRATHFGYALTRRIRRLTDEDRPILPHSS